MLHPDHLLEALTAQQLTGWLRYMAREPFGFPVEDARHGMRCAVSLISHAKPGAKVDPRHFMHSPPGDRELTVAETVAHFRIALGGSAKKKG